MKEFVPHVTVVVTDTPILFPNNDEIEHHVYSLSKPKKFELPLYTGIPSNAIIFEREGAIALGCNIHDWMSAYIYVVPTSIYTMADGEGKATLTGVPPGEYEAQVWHPLMRGKVKKTAQKLTVKSKDTHTIAFTIKRRKEWKPRRAPSMGSGGYR